MPDAYSAVGGLSLAYNLQGTNGSSQATPKPKPKGNKEMATKSHEFNTLLSRLVRNYKDLCSETENRDANVAKFLDDEGVSYEFARAIDPGDIVRALGSDFHREWATIMQNGVSVRTKLLLGICEIVEHATRPEPKFRHPDIIMNDPNGTPDVMFVMDYVYANDEYVVEHPNGDVNELPREWVEEHCFKVGQVTKDVKAWLDK
jgi:hypothetical protein